MTDCYRGTEKDVLLGDELDKFQEETETAIKQIEIQHNTKVAFLKEGIIEENETQLEIQHQKIKEQADTIHNQQEYCNEFAEKNSNLLYQVEEYRTECRHLTESITGIQVELSGTQKELLDTQQNFEDESIAFVELEEENQELKNRLRILGLTYVGARCRGLHKFNRINQRYNHQRNRAHQAEQALAHCQTHGNFLRSRELYGRLTIRAQKKRNVTLLTEKFAQ